jgi:hypothetical protein
MAWPTVGGRLVISSEPPTIQESDMPDIVRASLKPAVTPRLGDPSYSLLSLVAGTLLQVGTEATSYMSSFAFVRRGTGVQAAVA